MYRSMQTERATSPGRGLLSVCAFAVLALSLVLAACSGRPAATTASPIALHASMVLNRALFLSWTEAPEAGFGRYEVYAAPSAEELPDRPTAVLEEADHCYLQLRGLQPETEYAFRVRLVPADGVGGVWSETVRATTLKDGFPEDTPSGSISVPTIMYHHVRPLDTFPPGADAGGWYPAESFERDLAWMKANNVHAVTTADILDGHLPENPVFLTFDDGYTDFLEYAVPILVKYGFQAANAIVTQRTGGQSVWAIPEWPLDSLMTWPQIRRCLQAGMEMGGHTQTHVHLYLKPDQMGQVRGSFDDFVDALGFRPLYFCYPWGMGGHDFGVAKAAVEEAGYRFATATWPPRTARLDSDPFFFPRRGAFQNDTLRDFRANIGFPEAEGGAEAEPPSAEGPQAG